MEEKKETIQNFLAVLFDGQIPSLSVKFVSD